ncbi:MAG: hypothetical protein IID51_07500 [Proteobacteria bacterium]|nr:hypothetical protein [Pseudomonadota bacterium]
MEKIQPKVDSKSQAQRFKDKARELGCDEDEKRFERTLKRISKQTEEKQNPPER